jgi:hypothetical protein
MKRLFACIMILFISVNAQGESNSINTTDTINRARLYTVIGSGSAIYVGGISFLAYVWYKDEDRVPFHFYNDGAGYLQMDKFGHAYVAYWESYYAYHALRWAGLDKRRALLWGGPAGFVFQAPIEIFDGLYEGWGFSWWDMAANAFGSALFTAQQVLFDEQITLMKFSYSPSIYPDYHHILGESHLERIFLDYNAHTYWFSANINRISGTDFLPTWLNIAVGYSANGMIHEFDNPEFYRGKPFPHFERYRQFFVSLDIDFSRIQTNKKWLRPVLGAINMIKIPFPALEYNRLDGLKFNPIYF